MKKAASRLLRLGLSALIIVGLVLFARKVNWHTTWENIKDADRTILIAAAAVNLASLVLKGVRWWIFLRPVGAESLWLAIKATFAGAGLNNILVANGGEAARVVFVARAAHVQSAKILATLARSPGRVFTRDMLLSGIWGDSSFRDQRTIDVHIRHLREKLEPEPEKPRYILTVRGAGYRLRGS